MSARGTISEVSGGRRGGTRCAPSGARASRSRRRRRPLPGWRRISSSVTTRAAFESMRSSLQHRRPSRPTAAARRAWPRWRAAHRPRHVARHRLGIELADALGHQLAEDDGEEGDAATTTAVDDDAGRAGAHAEPCHPRPTAAAAKAASPTMPLSMPIEVMPICTLDRNCVGSSISLSAAAAPASPVSASAARRARRLVERAISDIANNALSVVSKASRKTSMYAGENGNHGTLLDR